MPPLRLTFYEVLALFILALREMAPLLGFILLTYAESTAVPRVSFRAELVNDYCSILYGARSLLAELERMQRSFAAVDIVGS